MIVLDTNIVSEFDRPRPDEGVVNWVNERRTTDLHLTTPTIAELTMGGERMLMRSASRKYLERLELLLREYGDRILTFDLTAARAYGQVVALRVHAGRPILVIDAMIAAICMTHDATLATRNVRDFAGLDLKVVNPFEAGA